MTKSIFCANCQTETEHSVEFTVSEVLATCDCGRTLKFPAKNDAAFFRSLLDAHKSHNSGQVKATEPPKPSPEVKDAFEAA